VTYRGAWRTEHAALTRIGELRADARRWSDTLAALEASIRESGGYTGSISRPRPRRARWCDRAWRTREPCAPKSSTALRSSPRPATVSREAALKGRLPATCPALPPRSCSHRRRAPAIRSHDGAHQPPLPRRRSYPPRGTPKSKTKPAKSTTKNPPIEEQIALLEGRLAWFEAVFCKPRGGAHGPREQLDL